MNHFDERAATWDDDPAKVERAEVTADAIRAAVELDGSQRLLEYGAGTGLVTQALRDAVGPVTLVDTSSGMRDVIEAKIAAGVISDARVWDVDLETSPAPGDRFDVIVTVMTLHHIGDVDVVLTRFAELLDPRGWLCVADLDHEDGSFHGAGHDVHHGFERAQLETQLRAAGFVDVTFSDGHHVVREGAPYPMFLAVCRLA